VNDGACPNCSFIKSRTDARKSSIRGIYVCAKGLDIPKFDKLN